MGCFPDPWDPSKYKPVQPLYGLHEAPNPRVGIYNVPQTERRFSEFIDVEQVKEPLLRPFFKEGGADIVNTINKDQKLQDINRLMWQSFNNYQWESNQEVDNPLFALELAQEQLRFQFSFAWRRDSS